MSQLARFSAPEIIDVRNKKFPTFRHKKSLSIVGGLILGAVLVLLALWFDSRPIPPRTWAAKDIEAVGIRVRLKTEWRDVVKYQFSIIPKSVDLQEAFNTAVQTQPLSFNIIFYDHAGFELCNTKVDKFTRIVSPDGLVAGLSTNETFSSAECSRSSYKEAASWAVHYRFPRLEPASAKNNEPVKTDDQISKKKAITTQSKTSTVTVLRATDNNDHFPSSFNDKLTGFDDLNGHLELQSGLTFLVDREGERSVVEDWKIHASVYETTESLFINCKSETECLIENAANKQAVHGKLIK